MRIANLGGRLSLIVDGDLAVDVATASKGRFGPDVQACYEQFGEMVSWANKVTLPPGRQFDREELGSPVPAPRQLFAIGLNYRAHADESGFDPPPVPTVFTKFVSSVTGPYTTVTLPDDDGDWQIQVDWEVELVVVIGKHASQVGAADAWNYVAGLTVGQDLSERHLQLLGSVPQFSLAKSYPGFSPIGPWVVTPDELEDRDDMRIRCKVGDETVQDGQTRNLIFSVPELIEKLSGVVSLMPGDAIFTGTPSGVGMARTPQRFLKAGDVLTSSIQGIGGLRQVFVSAEREC